jgi:glycosyltransferase involved in cell wall biosynthesis
LKIKVIFCTDGIFPHQVGGMQRHSRLLIEQLASNKEISLVVIHPHPAQVFDGGLGITEEHVSPIDANKTYLLECYRYSKRVFAILLKYPDHLIYSQGLSVWYGIKKIAHRIIVNPHGLEPYQCISLKDKLTAIPFKFVFNYLFRQAANVVSLGGKLTDILKQHIPDDQKIIELPNAVTLPAERAFSKKTTEKLNLLFVGRFAHNKGIHILLTAIEELNATGYADKITYNLGGKGPLFEEYRKRYTFGNLNYLGFIADDQLIELYKNNDLFVLPTLFEGMPTVVLEAMSYGMPVIVSDVGATSELVSTDNGYLIPKNDTGILKKTILAFYNLKEEERKRLSENSYQKVLKNFTWEKIAEKHIQVFKQLIEHCETK